MIIGIVGDVHGRKGIRKADILAEQEGLDILLQAGDHYAYQESTSTPMFFIRGNHEHFGKLNGWRNNDYQMPYTKRFVDDYKKITFGGVEFGFLGGIEKCEWALQNFYYLGEDRRMWTEEDEELIKCLYGSDVLITHDKPWYEKAGEDYFCQVADMVDPDLYVHGHIHEPDQRYINGTHIISLPPMDEMWDDPYQYVRFDTSDQSWDREYIPKDELSL
jgi:predicted phosphodiesterase